MHFFTHCVLACFIISYSVTYFKNYIQLCLNVYLCHVFNNTKIKAFLSYCCILCSRIPEDSFGYLTSMQKSSPLNLCSGSNIELNSPTSHIQTLRKNRDMYVMAVHYLFYPIAYQFWQHTEQLSGKNPTCFNL